ncbi:helix-turn-helix protein [Haloactinopolyspora alba]|uniref:Helix-turn-helix protein n=1 Tax=Haloactinopolyspora alba TaxID=648780 RepID=A0A2P8DHG8_9ACTN|nr:helix-turn-helix transcriptional regulator [Haloactinopolyspora alba]PSK96667.1 helix-turn-helix protein [Haloactinopolyspora alba]
MDYPPRERVAAEVLAELARRRISRASLANGTGITYVTLQRRLSGKRPFTYDELAAVAEFFELPITTILARAESGVA